MLCPNCSATCLAEDGCCHNCHRPLPWIAEGDQPETVEQQLCNALPKQRWTRTSDTLILHGRRVCVARKPRCGECVLADFCPSAFH